MIYFTSDTHFGHARAIDFGGVDANGWKPVSMEEVVARFEGVEPAVRADWRRWAVSTENAEAREFARELFERENQSRQSR